MVLTPSMMIPLGTRAADFELPDPRAGETRSLAQVRGAAGTLVMFICNHCPFVKHLEAGLKKLGEDFAGTDIGIVAISSNDAHAYPEDGPTEMARKDYPFPYLYDASQQTARDYGAVCTPDFFVFDRDLACVYRGQFDDARPGNDIAVTGRDIRAALQSLLDGVAISATQTPSVGCNIKWRDVPD